MVLWTSPVAAAAGAASLCGSLFWSGVCASGFFWSVLGSCSGFLPWSGAVVEGCCWSGLAGCDCVELGAVLGDGGCCCGMLCATANPLPSTTINASLFKCCLTIVLRFFWIRAPRQQIRVCQG